MSRLVRGWRNEEGWRDGVMNARDARSQSHERRGVAAMKSRDNLTTSPCHPNGLVTDDQNQLNAVRTEIKFLLAPRIRRHASDVIDPLSWHRSESLRSRNAGAARGSQCS
jgi:hypothetical protein